MIDADLIFSPSYLLGRAESCIQIAAERLESGRQPKEVAAFLREQLHDIEAKFNAPRTSQDMAKET